MCWSKTEAFRVRENGLWSGCGGDTAEMFELQYEVESSILSVEFKNHVGLYAAQGSVKRHPCRPCTENA